MRTKKFAVLTTAAVLLAGLGAVVAFAATPGTGSWSSGWQMMGGRYVYRPATSTPIRTLAGARSEVQQLAGRLGLRVDEVLQFTQNYYAKLVDGKGNGATEVLVDPSSGVVSIEYGPAMMWNTRYGMMYGSTGRSMMGSYGASMMGGYGTTSGMMGGYRAGSTSTGAAGDGSGMMGRSGAGSTYTGGYGSGIMAGSGYGGPATTTPTSTTVSLAAAHTVAQRWLTTHERGVSVETGGDEFRGYYTLETLNAGRITGMISVNATSGAVWPHWWHGAFIAKSQ